MKCTLSKKLFISVTTVLQDATVCGQFYEDGEQQEKTNFI